MATAAGKVVQIGTKGAYGRLVTLQHGKTYQTGLCPLVTGG
uniref:Uncharacterized protein n=1 Tax=uncultured gamma proteobacterium EF100_93H11 TaxID=710976 RepID=E0Y1U8_9GAMM|nr:hypothetical protein [uncultured gamma proteobacterium EF100_93H11]